MLVAYENHDALDAILPDTSSLVKLLFDASRSICDRILSLQLGC